MEVDRTTGGYVTRRKLLKYGLYAGLTAGLPIFWQAGCKKQLYKRRPNVLLISIDTTRRDHCSIYGYRRHTTPNLCRFAEQGARFELAYAPSSTTGPSHATFFTSLYPIAHQVVKNGLKLSDEHVTLAEILKTQGYQTPAVVSSFALNNDFGYAQGFEIYDDDFMPLESTIKVKFWEGHRVDGSFDRRADFTTSRAIRWLENERNPRHPFFMFVHYFDPHGPHTPPEPFDSRFFPNSSSATSLDKAIAKYDAEIAFTDQEVGNLLKALKGMALEDQTLVVITSDHGEGLMQHGHMAHGVNIYEELVRVPLLFRWPNRIPKGLVLKTPVGLIDLTPTILDLIGIKPDIWSFQGKSLAAAIRGQSSLDPRQPVYLYRRHYKGCIVGETRLKGEKIAVRIGHWKYIEGQEENTKELFNLETDPHELRNLYAAFPKKAFELASQLENWRQSHTKASTRGMIKEEHAFRLKSLGYVE
jgi:arylsulfatase A-like enzyme